MAKIQLSTEEAGLIVNAEVILTKQRVIEKVTLLFSDLHELMKSGTPVGPEFWAEAFSRNGKISKGENYRGLPYVMLDYPSLFSRENVFAVRTMFWWGNFFSTTLHLSGSSKIKYLDNPGRILRFLQQNDFFICVNGDECEHHFLESNYIDSKVISDLEFEDILKKPFFKAARTLPVAAYDQAGNYLMEGFQNFLEFLKINYQGGKKDPLPGFPRAGFDL